MLFHTLKTERGGTMAADGYLNFDTRLSTKGFEKGIEYILKALGVFEKSIKNLGNAIGSISEIKITADASDAQRAAEGAEADIQALDGMKADVEIVPDVSEIDSILSDFRAEMEKIEDTSEDTDDDILDHTEKTQKKIRSEYAETSERAMDSYENTLSSIRSTVGKIAGVAAAAFAADKIIDFGKQAVELASDMQEVQNVVDTAFGDMAYKMEEFADGSIKQFGISKLSAKQTGSTFAAMASGMGIAQDSATDMAVTLTGLSADMASFYNVEQDVASTALKSVFTGETETLKQFGIVMTEANLEAYALSQGITKSYQAMTQAEKVQLRYNYVMAQTALAQGDFAKTSGGWANQTRILSEQWKELSGIIGNVIMNVALPVVQALNSALSALIGYASEAYNALAEFMGWEAVKSSAAGIVTEISGSVDEQNALTDAVNDTAAAQENALAGFDKINKLSDSSGGASSAGTSAPSVSSAVPVTLDADTKGAESSLTEFRDTAFGIAEEVRGYLTSNFGASWAGIWNGLKTETAQLYLTMSTIFSNIRSLGEPLKTYFMTDFTVSLQTAFATIGTIVVGLFDTFNLVFSDIWNLAVFPALSSFITLGLPVLTQFHTSMIETLGVLFTEAKQIFDMLWIDAVQPVLTLIGGIWNDLMLLIADAWAKWGDPIFDGIKTAITTTGDLFENIWKTVLKPVWDTIMDVVDEVWTEHLKPLAEKFLDFVGTLIDGALQIYNEFIAPLVDWFVDVFGPPIAGVFSFLVETIGGAIGDVLDIAGSIIDALSGLIDFVVGIFTGDWEKAWQGIKDFFGAIWDGLVGIVKAPINLIIDLVNGLTGAIEGGLNWIIDGINMLSFDIPDWVPLVGGETFGFDIDPVDIPEIPRLATGTVIPANYGEFLAVLGDNKREAEVVAPLSTIEQAVRNATGDSNGGGDINLTVNLDGKTVYKTVIRRNNESIRMTGKNPLAPKAT